MFYAGQSNTNSPSNIETRTSNETLSTLLTTTEGGGPSDGIALTLAVRGYVLVITIDGATTLGATTGCAK